MKSFRIPSLILAAILQILPLARVAALLEGPATPLFAIVFRWAAAATALGGIEAVSGASTVITNPMNLNATNGVPFTQRLTTAPDQAHYYSTTALPAGLTLQGTSGATFWQIKGTPTVSGTFRVTITAKDLATSGADRTVTGVMTLNIIGGVPPPTISAQPQPLTIHQGQNASFTVTASGTGPFSYKWFAGNTEILGATASTLTLTNVQSSAAGNYSARVSNTGGTTSSNPALLAVQVLSVNPVTITPQGLQLKWSAIQNEPFDIVSSTNFTSWTTVLHGQATNSQMTVTLPKSADRISFYRVSVGP
jgi:hypothetical protein